MGTKTDYLGTECDLGGLTIPEFQSAFCSRCTQPECGRSLVGKSKFEQRITTWESRLFTNVPRMGEDDPRYASISNTKFMSVDVPPPGTQSEWVDPKDHESTSIVVSSNHRSLPIVNTPFQNGTIIDNSSNTAAKPVSRDPWAVPAKQSTDNIVKPGAKVKLGGV